MQGRFGKVDLKLLHVFRTVVECGGFSAAESELNIQRSTISTHMADLESRLDCRLCQRGRGGFSLTESGRVVYDAALQLFASIEQFGEHVADAAERMSGSIAVGVVDSTVTDPGAGLVKSLGALKEAAPGLQINLSVAPPTEIEQELLAGRLHIGVVPRLHRLPGLDYRPLYRERNALYCAVGHLLFDSRRCSLEDIRAADYVARGYEGGVEALVGHLSLRVMGTARSMEGAATLILTGRYIGFLPTHYAGYWVDRGMMRDLLADELSFHVDFDVVVRQGAELSRPARMLLELLGTSPAGLS